MDLTLNDAVALHTAGNMDKAENLYLKFISHDENLNIRFLLGLLYSQKKQYQKAIYHLEKSSAIQKNNPDWHNALAMCYQKLGFLRVANRLIQIAVQQNPSNPHYTNRYCKILNEQNEFQIAIKIMSNYLTKNTGFPEVHITLANSWKLSDKPFETVRCLIKTYRQFKDHPHVMLNLADALITIGRYRFAKLLLNQLISRNLMIPESLSQLAIINRETGNFNSALEIINQAYHTSPGNQVIQWNYGLLHLLTGDHINGWKFYDSSITIKNRSLPSYNIPVWKGESLESKTLLIIGEQGLGDQIMFSSQLDVVLNLGANIVLTCDARLHALFHASFTQIKVVDQTQLSKHDLVCIDYMILIGSLYPVMNNIGAKIIPKKQYLYNKEITKNNNSNLTKKIRIGFSWKGGTSLKEKRKRSINLKLWKSLLSHSNIKYYCLQHNLSSEELSMVENNQFIETKKTINDNSDFDELCNVISKLDLVITVDNTIAHLSAGLGVTTWCLIPYSPDWRWGLSDSSSLWYESMTLFRQKSAYNWHETLEQLENHLICSYFPG